MTSLMKSCISSVLTRFSMLSLTLCSWPESVWMMNHWLRMKFLADENPQQDLVNDDDKQAEQSDHDDDQHGRAAQFNPARPGALLKLFACFLHVKCEALDLSLPPKVAKETANHHRPNRNCNPSIHKNSCWLAG